MALAIGTAVLFGLLTSSASAAFPGRDGLLAVQPVSGAGLVLVDARGARPRTVCVTASLCGAPRDPRWSPDGQVLAFSSADRSGVRLIYVDGSCLDCQPFGADAPAFVGGSALVSAVSGGALIEYGSDGEQRSRALARGVSDAAWSAAGALAAVRGGQVWVGVPGRLRSLGAGSGPSWAPDGAELAIVRNGWITVIHRRGHAAVRLAKGRHPAWSPDGKSVAFIGAHDELRVVSVHGGRARRVGQVRGLAVDWQPRPAKAPAGCAIPPDSTVLASSAAGLVTGHNMSVPEMSINTPAVMGCLRATGRERLLERFEFESYDADTGVSAAATAGSFAALAEFNDDLHYGGSSNSVKVFNLSTGVAVPALGGETAGCGDYEYSCLSSLDSLAVDGEGFTAAHTTAFGNGESSEEIQASDSSGVHVLDSVPTQGGPPTLTALALSGETVTWDHAGVPKSAQLH